MTWCEKNDYAYLLYLRDFLHLLVEEVANRVRPGGGGHEYQREHDPSGAHPFPPAPPGALL